MAADGRVVREGEWITLDGNDGVRLPGKVQLTVPEMPKSYHIMMKWADQIRRLGVRANADTAQDARKAREMGAEGIGLCRTEHMFFKDFEQPEQSADRQLAIQEMIIADNSEARRKALAKLRPFQRRDFIGIFEAMDGFPVTIRLIDPPLARICAARSRAAERARATKSASSARSWPAESSNSTNPIRCSATAAAACASPIPKSWRCRWGRSSTRPSNARRRELKFFLRSCIHSRWTARNSRSSPTPLIVSPRRSSAKPA